jgi:PAS domain S-box-containing protein
MEYTQPRILIVDDEAAHAEAIRRALEGGGMWNEIRVAGALAEYRAMVSSSPPDIALLDLNLPDGKALEVLTSPPEAAPFPIIIMTSYGDERTAVEALKAGALDYLVKSAGAFMDMPHTVERALRDWRLQRAKQQAEEALLESEEKYRIVVEQANDGIVMLQGRKMLFTNPRFLQMSGYKDEQLSTLQFPQVVMEEKLAKIEDWLERLEKGETPEALEFDLIRVDGSSLPVEASAGPLRYRDRPAALLVLRDTSERKEAERKMQKARSDLLYAVSHELKTPLMTMLQAQELLNELEDREALARFRDYQETWQRNLLRLHRMINNLVDSQRTAETAFPMRLVSSQVEEIIKSVHRELTGYAQMLQVDLWLELEALPAVAVDVEAIGRVAENLVTNAIKFSHKGGCVNLRLWMEGDTLLFQVEDHGSGIPFEEQERLFQPFIRGRDADRRGIPGTGLGLFVSRRIVEEHGGTLTLESEEGKGTSVTVRLPWKTQSSQEPA